MEKWTALLLLAGIVGGISICCPGWGKAPASLLRAPAPAPDAQAALNSSGANALWRAAQCARQIFCPSPRCPGRAGEIPPIAGKRRAAGRIPGSRGRKGGTGDGCRASIHPIWAAHGATAAAHDRMDGSVHGDLTGIFVASCEASKKQTR